MALQVACPRCDFVLERPSQEGLPAKCPSCGARLTCPNCGSTLELNPQATGLSRCPRCEIELGRAETGPLQDEVATPPDLFAADCEANEALEYDFLSRYLSVEQRAGNQQSQAGKKSIFRRLADTVRHHPWRIALALATVALLAEFLMPHLKFR